MPRKATVPDVQADSTSVKKTAKKSAAVHAESNGAQTVSVTKSKVQVKKPEKQKIDPNGYITVRNGFNGRLVYISKRTGEKFVWDEFGAEQDMELQELKNAKNSYKTFFENNWFMIEDPEIISYLGVERYYAKSLTFDEFEDVFTKTPDEIEARISVLPEGQKQSLIYKAREMVADRRIDSIRVIETLERLLNTELTER